MFWRKLTKSYSGVATDKALRAMRNLVALTMSDLDASPFDCLLAGPLDVDTGDYRVAAAKAARTRKIKREETALEQARRIEQLVGLV
jgi:hypothetical protein